LVAGEALVDEVHRARVQLEHLYGLIAIVCYGGATVLTALAADVLWTF
jgi:hypothetical protein